MTKITKELVEEHGINKEEYKFILESLPINKPLLTWLETDLEQWLSTNIVPSKLTFDEPLATVLK